MCGKIDNKLTKKHKKLRPMKHLKQLWFDKINVLKKKIINS